MSFWTGSRCMHRLPPSLQGNSRRAGNDVLHLLSRGHLTPICGHGIGQRPGRPHTDSGFVFDMQRPIFLQARQEMPPATSFSMASSCACNKVWLAECNELQIRRLYLRVVSPGPTWPPWRRSRRLSPSAYVFNNPRSFQDSASGKPVRIIR